MGRTFCLKDNTLKDNTGTFKAAIISALLLDIDETMTSSEQKAEIYISLQ